MNAIENYMAGALPQSNALAQLQQLPLQSQQNTFSWTYPYGYWGGTCPSCGYCKCCGRSNSSPHYPQQSLGNYGQFSQTTNMAPAAMGLNSLPGTAPTTA